MTITTLPTFEVDREGMAKLFARKGKAFIVTELLQNAWDEDTTHVDVVIEPMSGGRVKIIVEDDNPEGFKNLTHAYTLFAESEKKSDPTKRGRFNLGEKLVVAMCDEAVIQTTKGTVVFFKQGRTMSKEKRKSGSMFTGILKMTKAELAEVEAVIGSLIPPVGIQTTYNLTDLPQREPTCAFDAPLKTEHDDAEGNLKPTVRKARVELFLPLAGETATLYELGIPVVPTGDLFHVNVHQKVPLNMDRDNVTPAYLRDLRTLTLNRAWSLMSEDELRAGWVTEALQDEHVSAEAVAAAMDGRYGEKHVIADPTDPEANKLAMAAGYTVIPGGALPKAAWKNVKKAKAAKPAGQVTPSASTEGAVPMSMLDPEHYPIAVEQTVGFVRELARALTGAEVQVSIGNDAKFPFRATYQRLNGTSGRLMFNLGRLGFKWFGGAIENIVDLTIHELGHHYCSDHLDDGYYDALTMLAGRAVRLALDEPARFEFREATVSA